MGSFDENFRPRKKQLELKLPCVGSGFGRAPAAVSVVPPNENYRGVPVQHRGQRRAQRHLSLSAVLKEIGGTNLLHTTKSEWNISSLREREHKPLITFN